jgi:hydrophobic/amphiphilic exporter-1 (mainly G- bacteria), HAE1 family
MILLGLMSLARLPDRPDAGRDLPEPDGPGHVPGVGPLEMEELVTRPIEQTVAAVSGLERLESTSSEGSSRVTLNFAWGTDLNEAADDVRNRLDRVRGRLPQEASAPTMFRFDANAMPIMGIGVEGTSTAWTLREMAEQILSPRLERVAGVAAVSVEGGCAGRFTSSCRRRRSPRSTCR